MIHPSAIIGENVSLGANVSVGPYTVIDGEEIVIGDDCTIGPHCHICGYTTIGARTRIHNGAVIGDLPQDYDFTDAVTYVRIGEECQIREYVTIHRGTKEGSATVIGNNCMIMGFVHLAHNVQLADRVVIANNSMLAGYVEVGERAFISSMVGIHQFVRIGALAMLSAQAHVSKDVAPYCMMAVGDRIYGPNVVGLRRGGFGQAERTAIKESIKLLFFSSHRQSEALEKIEAQYGSFDSVKQFVAFAQGSKRGLTPGR